MSTAGAPTATTLKEKKGLRKYISRLKSIFKGDSASNRKSAVAADAIPPPAPIPTTTSTDPAQVPIKKRINETLEVDPNPQSETKPAIVTRSARQYARAQSLAARYDIQIDVREWQSLGKPAVELVQKPIRMRIHRLCHQCGITFGASRTCAQCKHTRCENCPRYPLKKGDKGKGKETVVVEKGQSAEMVAASPVSHAVLEAKRLVGAVRHVDGTRGGSHRPLTLPSKTGGQDLVRKRPKQRVRRACHECQVTFHPSSATRCEGCGHIRCVKCPREPPKLNKWPTGYPGDVGYMAADLNIPDDGTYRRATASSASGVQNAATLSMVQKSLRDMNIAKDTNLA